MVRCSRTVIVAFKGMLEQVEDVYVTNIEKQESDWIVTDETNIGLPSVERLEQSSLTEKFEARYTNKKMKI